MSEPNPIKILLIDDEEDILEFLSYDLSKAGYDVRVSSEALLGIKIAKEFVPNIIILDIMMPEMNGIEVCTSLREDATLDNTIIVFLTARNESFTQISAFESGGDDFIHKPIKLNVLKSKIKALTRRYNRELKGEVNKVSHFGDLSVNFDEFKVVIKGEELNMTKKEFQLLSLLVSRPGKVFERAEILNKVWGNDVIVGDRTIDVHIRKLREKIGKGYIKTMKGVGYRFKY